MMNLFDTQELSNKDYIYSLKKYFYLLLFALLVSCKSDIETIYYNLKINSEPEEAGVVNPETKLYEAGELATISATPNSGYVFDRWTGDISSKNNPELVAMNSDKNITAIFGVKPEKSFDFSQAKGLMVSKAKLSSASNSNSNYNAQLINFNGELENLNIPGAKSVNLDVIRAFDLNDQYLYLAGW